MWKNRLGNPHTTSAQQAFGPGLPVPAVVSRIGRVSRFRHGAPAAGGALEVIKWSGFKRRSSKLPAWGSSCRR